MSQPQINTRVDHFAELKAAVNRACSVAEDNGVSVALIRNFFQGCHTQYVQRALFVADQANAASRMHDQHGNLIDHAGNVARVRAIREEKRRLADEAEYRAELDRRFEEDKIRSENRR
jgi:hypothetical protein